MSVSPSGLSVSLRLVRPKFVLDVAFDVPPGVTVLFGPSGSGKSSTLGAIAGIHQPASGRISLGSVVWFDSEQKINLPIHARKVAYVFQSLALFPHMTAWANVAYGIDSKLPKEDRRALAEQMLQRMRVDHVRERFPATFSGGEAQRVALARALAMSPRMMLLDEPFSALDRALRKDLLADVRTLVEDMRIPLLHVTHHHGEARALGERVVLLENGRIKGDGPVQDLLPP